MQIIWVNVFKNTGFEVELSLKKTFYNINKHRKSIYEVQFRSKTRFFVKVYPDYSHAL